MSSSSRPVTSRGPQKILTIDWTLLWRHLRRRGGQFWTAARYRASQTEYIPPAWMTRFRLSWFRIGLVGIALFVFTQKQIDFTVSVGREGIAAGTTTGRHSAVADPATPQPTQTANLSILPALGESSTAWHVDKYDAATVRAYVNRFERVAKTEEEKFSIPAPAKMAMAILASDAGRAPATRENNNHFGAIATNGYYENAWTNWRAHSEIVQRQFPDLAFESVNYQQWIDALSKTNYSRDKNYASKLRQIIERFGLEKL